MPSDNTKRAEELWPVGQRKLRKAPHEFRSAIAEALDAAEQRGRESAEAELRRLRERIGRMVEREERYRLDATQRMDDLDAASHDRAALVLRSLLTAPQAREEE